MSWVTTGNLLDFCIIRKLIGIDLSRQKKIQKYKYISQQINFTGKLDKDDRATIFFIPEK